MPDMRELVGRALDAAVAERVMGWKDFRVSKYRGNNQLIGRPIDAFVEVPHYSSDDNAARLVLNRIVELELETSWANHLWKILELDYAGDRQECVFAIAQSTAEQKCRAALAAVEQRAGSREGE